jgi:hypothetical protein
MIFSFTQRRQEKKHFRHPLSFLLTFVHALIFERFVRALPDVVVTS